MDLGLTTVVNVETSKNNKFSSDFFTRNKTLQKYIYPKDKRIPPLQIVSGTWISFSSLDNLIVKKDKDVNNTNNPRCTNILKNITIDPNYNMISCCGLSVYSSNYLKLGNVLNSEIKTLYNKQFNDLLKLWLYTDGPHEIINFILKRTEEKDIQCNPKMHMCQVCQKLLSNETLLNLIRNNYKEIQPTILFKYMLKKTIL